MRNRSWTIAASVVALGIVMTLVACTGGQGEPQTQGGGQAREAASKRSLEVTTVMQWANSGHAVPVTFAAEEEGCRNCHDGLLFTATGGGFQSRMNVPTRSAGATLAPSDGASESAAPTGSADPERGWVVATDCRACHTGAGVRIAQSGEVTGVPNLDRATGGKGALCMACHNGWHQAGARDGELGAPHGSVQTDMFFGVNTLDISSAASTSTSPPASIDESQSPHTKITDTCVTCHMQRGRGSAAVPSHTFAVSSYAGCRRQGCHRTNMTNGGTAQEDYDGDGSTELFTAEVDGMLETLQSQINRAAGSDSFADEGGNIVFRGGPAPSSDDPAYQAAYNYFFVMNDRSNGIHNPPYTIYVLRQALAAVSGGQ